ncbi:hypothetical protein GGP92_003299 [Salinibacter ruber]|jgi:hypothetical protein|nr:hypothetical protein [Salinibacter ruber]
MHVSTDNTPLFITLIALALAAVAYMNGSDKQQK